MKKIRPSIRDCSSLRRGKIPYGGVALTQGEELKFLAGINHNTPFVFIHDINIMYGMLIACKELHWVWQHLGLTYDEITLCSHSTLFLICPNPDPSSGKPFVTSDSWRWFRIGDVNAGQFSGLGWSELGGGALSRSGLRSGDLSAEATRWVRYAPFMGTHIWHLIGDYFMK